MPEISKPRGSLSACNLSTETFPGLTLARVRQATVSPDAFCTRSLSDLDPEAFFLSRPKGAG
jgi:hypothetical protein